MPELPEVETIVRGLANRVIGDVIESVWLSSRPEPFRSPIAEIAARLSHARITGVRRKGKYIVFELENSYGPIRHKKAARKACAPQAHRIEWIVHLGMTGRMLICSPGEPIERHTHAIAKLESGRELRFVDPRRFGRLSVSPQGTFEPGGSEPLDITLDSFVSLFHRRKTAIKAALLNQKLLRGVGNIYADEALFRAGIRPRRQAATLTTRELGKLYLSLRQVLAEAILAGGSSIADYVGADGEEGFFQAEHRVYGRQGEPCLVCKKTIKRVVIGGRSSHYCPQCQR